MTLELPVIYVLGRHADELCRAARRAFGAGAAVRCAKSIPRPQPLAAADVVVVDLDDLPHAVTPEALLAAVDPRRLCLVAGREGVPPEWVSARDVPGVRVVACGAADRDTGFEPLVDALGEVLRRPGGDEVGRMVLEREPYLHPVASLVRIVCRHPWRTRRPRDLAAQAGTTLREIKEACQPLGFGRVEHFIVAVRMVALEQVMTRHGLAPGPARQVVGIADPSNHRRQLERALKGSAAAIRRLRTLVAA